MFLQEPQPSQYDINFRLLGFNVRVTWGFWVAAAVLGWNWSQGIHALAVASGMDSPSPAAILLIWIFAIFVSILVHELGHAVAFQRFGKNSRIVLYHFGGLAIPDSFGAWNAARQSHIGPREQVIISAAGPAFQLALAAVVIAIAIALQISVSIPFYGNTPGTLPGSAALFALFFFLIMPSIFWAILNLAPILPLDGGHIAHNLMKMWNINRPTHAAHMLSVGTGAVVGLYFMSTGQPFVAIMFLMFAASNWQAMQQFGGGGF